MKIPTIYENLMNRYKGSNMYEALYKYYIANYWFLRPAVHAMDTREGKILIIDTVSPSKLNAIEIHEF